MPNKIVFTDPNASVDGYHIYRSDAFIPQGVLPTPLASVPAGTLEYIDLTAKRNVVYHYRVGAYKGTEENVSKDRVLCYMPYTGPGPQTLLRGDWNAGYFGRIALADLFDLSELIQLVGIPGTQNATYYPTQWLKFVYKGKILFLPDGLFTNTVGGAAIYQAGLLYGNDAQSLWSTWLTNNFGVIPQGKTVRKGDDIFLVRAPRSRGVQGSETTVVPDSYRGNEFDQIFAAAFMNGTYAALSDATPIVDDLVNGTQQFFTMDSYGAQSANVPLLRGTGTFDGIAGTIGWTVATASVGFRPVLELVL